MNIITKRSDVIKNMVLCGVFTALAYVCVCVFRIKVQFLTLDIKDAIITTGAMLIHPVAGFATSILVALIEMFTISDTSYYGFIMNFLSSATFSVVASFIYRTRKSLIFAVVGLVTAVFSVTAVMMLANLFITPHFMGVDRGQVVALIPKLLLPFNLTKAVLNASLIMLIYKPISSALSRARVIKKSNDSSPSSYKLGVKTLAVTLCAITVIVVCFVVFFAVLNGEILPLN